MRERCQARSAGTTGHEAHNARLRERAVAWEVVGDKNNSVVASPTTPACGNIIPNERARRVVYACAAVGPNMCSVVWNVSLHSLPTIEWALEEDKRVQLGRAAH